ncbi:helix-turn-helix transcriptional regulator [Rhodovulum sulfidophilum]|uniref:AraC family transcriptional regulator n=1 Tax=Rhodovulum sulfidophilum TaxID=35806 RepID=UPI0019226340|nr:helix-turn-helix transcriptional regulator [Rhodovulum sulfidophilum]MBL3575538.1 helix-turn-helix transcriptional regulator [Rhodovulum sulfidophilum]MCE8431814.1 helix-turn-helix transcriptional regulator [Rhodovulum sulfidophilum]MCE8440002.1 helix-turn-helix transcriptional regulator [Rhodovulum sulfidophilum]MCE8467487.1 helix-turn-helix transcriptional regulator [Rhodovulum sulfidophilum]MCF4118630.1 helix-turn-helix transcriptional regulator [Rhodovulum sulfidophilum]
MVWLAPSDPFDADQLARPVVGIASRMVQHDSGWHSHARGQLLFAYAGSIRIMLPDATSILPPIRMVWIPPGTPHRVTIRSEVEYRSIYLDETRVAAPFAGTAIVAMTPLLREVFERMSLQPFDTDWSAGAAQNLLAVCLDELATARHEPMLLPVPSDPRLARLDIEELPPGLEDLSCRIGVTTRTISRIFRRETGMSYQAWRQSWRLLRAVDLLASGLGVTRVASDLGFSSDSAFIAFFRQMTGETPKRYIDKRG